MTAPFSSDVPGSSAEAERIEQSLLFQEQSVLEQQLELELLGFCVAKLGRRDHPLEPLPGASIEELLNYNDFHHRLAETPRHLERIEVPLLIVFKADNNPDGAHRRGRHPWLYDPSDQSHQRLNATIGLADRAFELYLPLPPKVQGPGTLLGFAFGSERWAMVALLITSAVAMVFNLSIPMLTKVLVSRAIPHNDQRLLIEGLAVVAMIVIGSVATQFLQNLMMLRLETVADLRLQSAVWDRLMRLPISFISRFTTGDLSSRVNAISQLRQVLGSGVLSTLLSCMFAVSYFVLMFNYDSYLAVWATGFTLLSVIGIGFIAWRSIQLELPMMESGAEITNFSLQAVMGMPQIRSAGAEPFVMLRWLREVNRYALLQLRSNVFSDALAQYGTLVTPLSALLLFAVVTERVINSSSAQDINAIVVSFITFNAAFGGFNRNVTGVVNLMATSGAKAIVLWQRAEPVMYADVERGYQTDAVRHQVEGEFRLRGISYEFPESSEQLFQDLTFTIPAGQHTAITGPSGCGKTTLVRMLLGFVAPNGGELLVDGIPLSQLAIRSYRRQLGVVMQTARLNGGSIYDVICGGVQRRKKRFGKPSSGQLWPMKCGPCQCNWKPC